MTTREWFRKMRAADWNAEPVYRELWVRGDVTRSAPAFYEAFHIFYHHELITFVDAVCARDVAVPITQLIREQCAGWGWRPSNIAVRCERAGHPSSDITK